MNNYTTALLTALAVLGIQATTGSSYEAYEHERKLITAERSVAGADAHNHKLRSLIKAHNNNQFAIQCRIGEENERIISEIHYPFEDEVSVERADDSRVYKSSPREVIMLLYMLRSQNKLQDSSKSILQASAWSLRDYDVEYRGDDIVLVYNRQKKN